MSQRKNVKTTVTVNTKPAAEEETKDEQENPAPEQQPEENGTASDKKTVKKTRKKFFIQSPIGVKTVEVVKEVEKSDETADEEQKPTFKERVHKFVNGLGTVALVTGVGLTAYGKYKMDKARELEEEDYPSDEDDEDSDEYDDPDSPEDEEEEEDD